MRARAASQRNAAHTAIFAAYDDMAAGAMVACARFGFNVPGDISICGFGDSWIAKLVWPYLMTIYQPIGEMADAEARLLLASPIRRDGSAGTRTGISSGRASVRRMPQGYSSNLRVILPIRVHARRAR